MSYEGFSGSTANSSFLSQEDTFLNTRRRFGPPPFGNGTTTTNSSNGKLAQHQSKSISNSNTSGYIASMNNISSFTPIKPLVDSPFKSPLNPNSRSSVRSTPLAFTNGKETTLSHAFITSSPSINDRTRLMVTPSTSLLKDKVKQQQSNYYTSSISSPKLNPNIHQSSIFRSRRGVITPYSSDNFQAHEIQQLKQKQSFSTMSMKQEPSAIPPSNEGSTAVDLDSPYVEIALKRITNKDQEIRKLIINSFLVLVYKFVKALINLILANLQLHKLLIIANNSNTYKYGSSANYVIYWILALNIGFSFIRLLRPQDTCLDLPLTDKQRILLGLPILSSSMPQSTDYLEDYIPDSTKTQQQVSTISSLDKPTVIKATSDLVKLSDTSMRSIQQGRDTSFAAMDISRSFAGMKLNSIMTPHSANNQQNQQEQQLKKQQELGQHKSLYSKPSFTSSSPPRLQDVVSPSISSPEKIKERLIQSRKSMSNISIAGNSSTVGSSVLDIGTANRSMFDDNRIKKPSSKFMYDVKNGCSDVSGYYSGDLSFY